MLVFTNHFFQLFTATYGIKGHKITKTRLKGIKDPIVATPNCFNDPQKLLNQHLRNYSGPPHISLFAGFYKLLTSGSPYDCSNLYDLGPLAGFRA